ncbi:hypothetical protein [Streptomyces sp. MOE7]|uniref:hypothetical protein n=1 Tax=Streptomyces sp. MOE7 TaxID=1961713 RepID=UPI0009FE5366|nr:hypothetical protein [Streptomyces sp. MOE7]
MSRAGGTLRRLARHEGRWMASLARWVTRRRDGTAPGERALPYAAAQAALVYGLTFVCAVETAGVHVLLGGVPVARAVLLVVDVYTVLMLLGFQAAAVTRPHVLGAEVLRLREGARTEVRIPVERIVSVRYDLRFTKEPARKPAKGRGVPADADGEPDGGGVAELAVGGQTSVTVELAGPVEVERLLGRCERVRTVRFHADDARGAVAAVRARMREREQERTAPGDEVPESPGRGAVRPG